MNGRIRAPTNARSTGPVSGARNASTHKTEKLLAKGGDRRARLAPVHSDTPSSAAHADSRTSYGGQEGYRHETVQHSVGIGAGCCASEVDRIILGIARARLSRHLTKVPVKDLSLHLLELTNRLGQQL